MSRDKTPPSEAETEHFVSQAPFDIRSIEQLSEDQEKLYLASQWTLMWWKFKRHRLAVVSGFFLIAIYLSVLISEFLAPYNLHSRHVDHIYAPPQAIHLFHDGSFVGPFVYATNFKLDMTNLSRVYTETRTKINPIRFFCRGDDYKLWGQFESNLHLFCPAANDGTLFLLGTDRLGRDVLSRIIYGARISLTISLLGVTVSFLLGITFGGIAGYYGGVVDLIIQRIIEVIQSLPTIPLWLVLAAQLMGATPRRIIGRHLIPGFMSHLIASATISIPTMILGETALSFLKLGLRPPITSWGVLLVEAQNINVVVLYPWLMLPVVPVIMVIIAFSFLGDGLRDAADPHK
jgi:peptide/nickel transport system permease protein